MTISHDMNHIRYLGNYDVAVMVVHKSILSIHIYRKPHYKDKEKVTDKRKTEKGKHVLAFLLEARGVS